MGTVFEGVSKNKKIAQELAAQKFLKKVKSIDFSYLNRKLLPGKNF
jgi:hypothetical protein